ncbi:EamA family transporter [Rhizohabitans arisaemae]|uniref:EamA family transporter n=1 Tax=Rhizohabitans arisaemae TaxID=2720610 RepID=UPI0024B0943A|nr:DMT family transporter [Rhizohabitans arisaemae]
MRRVGLVLALVSVVCFAFSGPAAKLLNQAGLTSLQAVWIRVLFAAVLMFAGVAALKPQALRIPPGRLRHLVGYCLVGVAGTQLLFFAAITRLPVGIALLIEYTGPVLVVLWVRFVRRTRLSVGAYLGSVVVLIGLAVVVEAWQGITLDVVGILLALGAAAGLAGYFLLSDGHGNDMDPLGLISWGFVGGAFVLAPLATPWSLPWAAFGDSVSLGDLSIPVAFAAGWLVVVGTVVAYTTGVMAVRRLSAAVGATVASLEVVAASVVAFLVLGERLGPFQILGGLIVLVGVFFAQRATVRLPQAGPVPDHESVEVDPSPGARPALRGASG